MEHYVSNDDDSVCIQIVIIAIGDKFYQNGDESIIKTDEINSSNFENKHIGQSFGSSGVQVLKDCDDWDFFDDEEDVW
jgi:hypothetical protein